MRKLLRVLRSVLTGVLAFLLLAVAGIAGLLWLTLPDRHQTASIPGLAAPVDISFDADGIPRIHAGSALDAAAAIGFVHARDRMFQMELMRRAASGRLSEIAGTATLKLDRTMRTLGLRRRALADLATLPPDTRAMLDAYARGVNAWIDARGRLAAPEFLVLGRPEPWSPVDSLLWAKTMGLWLSGNWRTELQRAALAGHLPAARIDELWPATPHVPPADAHALPVPLPVPAGTAARLLAALPDFPSAFTLPAQASNEWAVDGRHSATGAPLLAGDPHLAFGQPGIWYLARIETPDGVLVGATGPGVPFLVLGHNGRIAWTFTTTGADTQDLFIETPAGDGRYATPDGPRDYAVREERIRVRGGPDDVLTVRETRHGPVISDLDGIAGGPVLAVAMANLAPDDTGAAGLLALNRARDIDAAGRAAALVSAPVQNLLVADRAHIALFVTGRVPRRRAGDGSEPVSGADGAHDWTGFAQGSELPHFIDPPGGRLVNANERVAAADFPVFMGRDWFADWRARRIRALLDRTEHATTADFAAIQADVTSAFAQQALPRLRAIHADGPAAAQALALLAGWSGEMGTDAPQPLIFEAWTARFHDLILAHAGIGGPAPGPGPDFTAFVLSPEGASWCDGDCDPMLRQALTESVASLATRFGADPAGWRWGAAHQAVFAHPILGRLPVLGPLTTARIASPGDATTIDAGGIAGGSFDSVHGPSYRGVYDLADLDRSLFVAAPGQSGNPVRPHAHDFLTRWRDGGTIMIGPTPTNVSATLRLMP